MSSTLNGSLNGFPGPTDFGGRLGHAEHKQRLTAIESARSLMARGFTVIPLPRHSKKPVIPGWPDLRITEAQLPEYFKAAEGNVGVLWGEPSGGVVDVDLDHPLAVELAPQYLPPTQAIFGRAGKRRSHWLYRLTKPASSRKWALPKKVNGSKGEMVVELRSTGCQTLAPGSVHPSGDNVVWESDGDAVEVDAGVLIAGIVALNRAVRQRLGITGPERLTRDHDPTLDLLSRLKGVARIASGYNACCPSHDDHAPSLSISTGDDGRVLVHCHAGCDHEDIVAAVGLKPADLFARTSQPNGKSRAAGGRGHAADAALRNGESPRAPSQADRLVALVTGAPKLELFRTPEGRPYATVPVGAHIQTWAIQGPQFREWVSLQAYRDGAWTPNGASLTEAIAALAARARFDGPVRRVFVRLGRDDADAVYFDLCDPDWRVVRIDSGGWKTIPASEAPVRFTRRNGMLGLPAPERGGSVEELRPLLNLPDDDQWTLLVGWLVSALRPDGPYAVLHVSGEAGSAKSTLCRLARQLIDPNKADIRRPPKEERDLFVSAENAWLLAVNNLDGLPASLSDALCAIVSDAGYALRALNTDAEEAIFSARRPVMINGIGNSVMRSDLLDRSIGLCISRLPDETRMTEREIQERFERARPRILGALLDAVAAAIRNEKHVQLKVKPRLADVAVWVTAAEAGLNWPPGRFLAALMANRTDVHADAVENSPIGPAILSLVKEGPWEGIAKELLERLVAGRAWGTARDFPRDGAGMTRLLQTLAPSLRAMGIDVDIPGRKVGHAKRRTIRLALRDDGAPHAPQ